MRPTFLFLALVLAAIGIFGDEEMLRRLLAIDPQRSLAWGPLLFRAASLANAALLAALALIPRPFPADAAPPARSTQWADVTLTIPVLLVALGVRLIHLDADLWIDELATFVNYGTASIGELMSSFESPNQHMFYSVLMNASVRVFGNFGWAARLPAVAFGVASIAATVVLGRRLTGRPPALLAGSLMAVSYHHVWYSQSARGYTVLLFLANAAMWLWIEAREHDRERTWSAYAIAIALGVWTQMGFVFVVAAHAVVHLIESIREGEIPWKAVASWSVAGLLTIQLYALGLPEFFGVALSDEFAPSKWTNPIWALRELIAGFHPGWAGLVGGAAAAVVALVGWIGLARESWQLALAISLPPLLLTASMMVIGHAIFPRYVFFSMGFGLIVGLRGLFTICDAAATRLGQSAERGHAVAIVVTGVLLLGSATTLPRAVQLPKQDFTGARELVEARRNRSEPVIAVGIAGGAYGLYYAPEWSSFRLEEQAPALRRLLDEPSRSWIVFTLPTQLRAYRPALWKEIENRYEVVERVPGTLRGGAIVVAREIPRRGAP